MLVRIPSPLHSYTKGVSEVEAEGRSVAQVLDELDRRYPGLRFRIIDEHDEIRPHIRIFVNADPAPSIAHRVGARDEIMIVCALSGG
ncbi:MAG: MoaD/ThiS family protein [Planctomycetes bacterium]|nr:MoaD/ThiS family protein [Planctomycetota bacterium]